MAENPYFHRTPIKDQRFFFGRTAETRSVLRHVINGQPVSIVGPRRIGKSSLLFHLCNPEVKVEYGIGDDYIFVYIDCQVLSRDLSKTDVYRMLLENVMEAAPDEHKTDYDSREPMTCLDFKRCLNGITASGLQIIFLLDEFETIAGNRRLGEDFFNELRGLGQTDKVVYITASGEMLGDLSFHDESILSSPFFNIFSTVWLGFMEPKEARALIDGLAAMTDFEGFDENDHSFLREIAGPHPFYLNMACYLLFEEKAKERGTAAPDYDLVKRQFAREAQVYFEYTWSHLSDAEQKALKLIVEGRLDQVTVADIERLDRKYLVCQGAIFSANFAKFVQQQPLQSLYLSQPEEAECLLDEFAVAETEAEPLRVLHLSDLHMKPTYDPESMLQPLIADLRDPEGGLGFERLDCLVVSGDLTHRAKPEEFERALQFLSELRKRFEVAADRCIIVPGNHDLDWDEEVYDWKPVRRIDVKKLTKGSYVEQGQGILLRNETRYPTRFKNFAESFCYPFAGQAYPLSFEEQCIPVLFLDSRIQFLAMNSCWEIDEYFTDRSSIHAGALARGLTRADEQIEQAKQGGQLPSSASVLRIAVWHHPVTGNQKIGNDAFLERLRRAGFKLCLHGHVHEERADLIDYFHKRRRLYVAGAGSFGAPVCDRPESIPRLYNLLEVTPGHSRIRVHTRCLRRETGAWEGWAVWPGPSPSERRIYYAIDLQVSR